MGVNGNGLGWGLLDGLWWEWFGSIGVLGLWFEYDGNGLRSGQVLYLVSAVCVSNSALMVEFLAIKYSLKLALNCGWKDIHLVSDSQVAVKSLKMRSPPTD